MRKILLIFLALISCNLLYAQKLQFKNEDELNKVRLEELNFREQGIANLFSTISYIYDVPIGFERALNENVSKVYKIDFKGGTFSELFEEIFKQNDKYKWTVIDGVVYVFPRDEYRDKKLKTILLTKLKSFEIKKNSSTIFFSSFLFKSPELLSYYDDKNSSYFSGFCIPTLGKDFEHTYLNESVESILDSIIIESQMAHFWQVLSYSNSVNVTISADCERNRIRTYSRKEKQEWYRLFSKEREEFFDSN